MIINLRSLYYYIFLATFTVIIFSNLIPSELVVITRLFVIPTSLLSLLLLNNIKGFLYVIMLYIFLGLYILYPLLTNDAYLTYSVTNTKYAMYFIFIFGLINILKYISLETLLYSMSKIFIIKLIVVALISLNMNFGEARFINYLLNVIDLNVHILFGRYRVFDVYLFLFPLLLIYIKDKKKYLKIIIHLLLLFNMLSAMSFGILFAYIVVMLIRYRFIRLGCFVIISAIYILYYEQLFDLYEIIVVEKSVSIDVKWNQIIYLCNNLSLFGKGLGTPINIYGRVDSMLENVLIYWFLVYGVIGIIFMIFFFVVFPFFIFYKYKKNYSLNVVFYMHLSVLLSSLTNPYLESVIGIMAMIILVAYYFSKKSFSFELKKINNQKGIVGV